MPRLIPNVFAAVRAMKVAKRGGRRHRRKMMGSGIMDFLKKAHDWVKSNKIISSVSGALSGIVPGASIINKVSDTLGYGRRRRGRKHQMKLRGGFLGISGH